LTIQAKQSDIDLLVRLLDLRDSAHLAGHTDDTFQVVDVNGPEAVQFSPGTSTGTAVSGVGLRRLDGLGLLQIFEVNADGGFTFDVSDDARDRLDSLRIGLGQPSRLGEAEAAKDRAEAALRDIEQKLRSDATTRDALRSAYASTVGRRVRRVATSILLLFYVGVIVVAGYLVTASLPIALVVGVIAVAVLLAVLDWLFHIDGFGFAASVERKTVRRVAQWLESFDVR
jgi:hypothetical protein